MGHEREREYQVIVMETESQATQAEEQPMPRQAAFYIQQIQLRKIESLCGEEL